MRVRVRVTTRAGRNEIVSKGDVWKVRVSAVPVDGKANEAVIAMLAKEMGVAKSHVRLVRGASGRDKVFEIESTP